MRHKALIRRLQISCLGLDAVDPLRLLVDDVVAALAQTERTWVGLTEDEIFKLYMGSGCTDIEDCEGFEKVAKVVEAKLKDKNDVAQKTNS